MIRSSTGTARSQVRLFPVDRHVWVGSPLTATADPLSSLQHVNSGDSADVIAVAAHFHGHMAGSVRRALDHATAGGLIRSGRAILIDGSEEGYSFNPQSFGDLHKTLETARIEPDRVVLATQNFALEPAYRVWAGAQGLGGTIRIAVHHHFLRLVAQEAAAALTRDGLRERLDAEIAMAGGADRLHRILCLNHKARPHRLIAVGRLARHDLLRSSLVSFHGGGGGVWSDIERNVELACRHWPACRADVTAFEAISHQLPLELDEPTSGSNRQRAFSAPNAAHFTSATLSLVTETEMGNGAVRRFTEKSVKPLAFGQFMIVLGPPKTLTTLHEYGFRTFSPLINESYDSIMEQTPRLEAALAEFDRLVALRPQGLAELLRAARSVLAHNIAWFVDGGLDKILSNEDEKLAIELRGAILKK